MEGDKHEQQSPVRPGLYRGVQRLRQLYAEGFISKEEVAMTLSCNAGFCIDATKSQQSEREATEVNISVHINWGYLFGWRLAAGMFCWTLHCL